jgi:hypothetical protein
MGIKLSWSLETTNVLQTEFQFNSNLAFYTCVTLENLMYLNADVIC